MRSRESESAAAADRARRPRLDAGRPRRLRRPRHARHAGAALGEGPHRRDPHPPACDRRRSSRRAGPDPGALDVAARAGDAQGAGPARESPSTRRRSACSGRSRTRAGTGTRRTPRSSPTPRASCHCRSRVRCSRPPRATRRARTSCSTRRGSNSGRSARSPRPSATTCRRRSSCDPVAQAPTAEEDRGRTVDAGDRARTGDGDPERRARRSYEAKRRRRRKKPAAARAAAANGAGAETGRKACVRTGRRGFLGQSGSLSPECFELGPPFSSRSRRSASARRPGESTDGRFSSSEKSPSSLLPTPRRTPAASPQSGGDLLRSPARCTRRPLPPARRCRSAHRSARPSRAQRERGPRARRERDVVRHRRP